MLSRDRERRQFRPYAPYIFFLLELMAIAELLYIAVLLFGIDSLWMYVAIFAAFLFTFRMFNRLVYVLRRNAEVKRAEQLRAKEILNY